MLGLCSFIHSSNQAPPPSSSSPHFKNLSHSCTTMGLSPSRILPPLLYLLPLHSPALSPRTQGDFTQGTPTLVGKVDRKHFT